MKVCPGQLVMVSHQTMFTECGTESELLGGAGIESHSNVALVLFVMSERRSERGSMRTFVLKDNTTGWIWDSWIESKIA